MKAKIFVGDSATGKTRIADMISEYVGKEKTLFISGAKLRMISPHVFSQISEDTQLLIIDDCHFNFDYSRFFPVEDNSPYGGELKFSIWIKKRGQPLKIIQVPFIIFTTNKLKPKWLEFGASFHERFDIVEFPISQVS